MATVPHWHKVHHGTGVAVRVFLNDVLFYRHVGDQNWTISGPSNHLFVPGENVIRVEVLPTKVPAHSPGIRGPVEAKVMLDDEANVAVAMVRWEWSNPNKEPPLPTASFAAFHPAGDISEPAYLKAPKERFGPEGSPELRDAVRRLHEAFVRQDGATYTEMNSAKIESYERAYPDNPKVSGASLRAKVASMMKMAWIVQPLDLDALVFENQADGRVAYVRRADGGKALQAVAAEKGDPRMNVRFATDVWLTRVDGAWKVFL
jgi:hypothetical protein